jgi:hypothetical protein
MSLRKAYYYLYYKLYKLAVSVSDDALNEWKPLVTILILEVLFIAEIFVWYSVATKKIFVVNNPLASFLPMVAVIGIANYLFFLHKDRWKNHIDEFKRYDKKRKLIGGAMVCLLITLIIGSLLMAFYQLSKIDWKQYR